MYKPWLKRNFENRTEFIMPVVYIIKHLHKDYVAKVSGKGMDKNFERWQSRKERRILMLLDGGLVPLSFDPISLELSPSEEKFYITDGTSRLRAFYKRKIPKIRISLGYAYK